MHFLLAAAIGMNLFTLIQLGRSEAIRSQPNRIGMAIILLWTLRFALFDVKFSDWAHHYALLLILDQNLFFLDGVLLWLYAKSLLTPIRYSWRTLLHFLPFGLFLFNAIGAVLFNRDKVMASYEKAIAAFENNQPEVSTGVLLFILLILVISIIYFIKSLREIQRYNYSLFQNFSNIDNLQVTWVITFQRLWIALFLLPILLYFINYIFPVMDMYLSGSVLIACYSLLSFFFNSNILNQSYAQSDKSSKPNAEKVKTASIDPSQVEALYRLLEEQKYYQDEQLSLNQLAAYLEVKPVMLTELIKQTPYDNFYDLINSYRLDAVKQDLLESQEQIMIVAYNNGFNSKSTFNKFFKAKTGMTPREYRLSVK